VRLLVVLVICLFFQDTHSGAVLVDVGESQHQHHSILFEKFVLKAVFDEKKITFLVFIDFCRCYSAKVTKLLKKSNVHTYRQIARKKTLI
jgi:hypothetical protein